MRPLTTPIVLTALLLAALPARATAQQADDDAFLRVPVPEEGEDRIHRLRTQVRHTTVIVLPADENILDFVVGDSEYWHLAGAANVAFLKPLSAGRGDEHRARMRVGADLLVPGGRAEPRRRPASSGRALRVRSRGGAALRRQHGPSRVRRAERGRGLSADGRRGGRGGSQCPGGGRGRHPGGPVAG